MKNSPNSDGSEARQNFRATRVWTRLSEMYGNRFLREYGEKPNRSWVEAVARMSDDQVIAALRNLAEQGSVHPPTLPQFVEASIYRKPNEYGLNYTPQVYRQRAPMNKMLDKPRDDAAGRLQAQQLLDMLRGKRGSA
jgi:hypothetical protein